MKLLTCILSILLLFGISTHTFYTKFDKKDNIRYTQDDSPQAPEDYQENQDEELKDVELQAFLNNNFYNISPIQEQEYTCVSNIYTSPSTLYDNPPPEG